MTSSVRPRGNQTCYGSGAAGSGSGSGEVACIIIIVTHGRYTLQRHRIDASAYSSSSSLPSKLS